MPDLAMSGSTGSLTPGLRKLMVATFVAYALFALYAAAVRHGLFADGAYILLRVIVDEGFVSFQPSRRSAHLLHQLPTIIALKLGITDLYALTFIYGLTLHLLPLLATLACYAALPEDKKSFFVFPYLHFVAGTLGSALAPLAEAPVASAVFWLILCLTLFGANTWPQRIALGLLSAGALLLHEVFSFLAIALVCAALYRASTESKAASQFAFRGLAAWFLFVGAVQIYYILNPSHPLNRESFTTSLIQFFWLRSGNVVNMPVALGILGLGAGLVSWAWQRSGRTGPPEFLKIAVGLSFALLAALAIGLPAYSDHFVVPQSQFAARNQSAFISLVLVFAVALTLRSDHPAKQWQAWAPKTVIICVAVGALGWLFLAMHYWALCVEDTKAVLASRAGLISWQEARSLVPQRDQRIFSRYSWGWTPPSVSILLAPDGMVSSIIDIRPEVQSGPFDPTNPSALPKSAIFNTDAYVNALYGSVKSNWGGGLPH